MDTIKVRRWDINSNNKATLNKAILNKDTLNKDTRHKATPRKATLHTASIKMTDAAVVRYVLPYLENELVTRSTAVWIRCET